MLWIRLVEEQIASEYSKQEMRCPVHLSVGQEAVPVGVSACLSIDDHVVSAHRSHAHYLAKGGDLERMLGELFGKVTGCARGKGGSMHLIDTSVNVTAAVPIVGSSISIGTGIGFGLKKQNSQNKVAVYFGDGATEEGVFSESLDFAALFKLPVLFVCENNFYSVYTPIDARQHKQRTLEKICEGHGIKWFSGDGNDVLSVKKATEAAIKYMDQAGEPAFLEFETYRWLEHCGPNWDDHVAYRKPKELEQWMERCPISLMRSQLQRSGLTDLQFQQMNEKLAGIISEAFQNVRLSDFPSRDELYQHIYAE